MTKNELYGQMRDKGYNDPLFFEELDKTESSDKTVAELIRKIEAGETAAAWADIEKYYDEFVYFSAFDDDCIVCQAAE